MDTGKVVLIIEVDKEDWEWLQRKILKTKMWKENGKKYGRGICIANDPEYTDDVKLIDATLIEEISY